MINDPRQDVVQCITHQKRQIIELRKIVHLLREALRKLNNEEELIQNNTMRFFKDVFSQVDHVITTMASQREILSGFMDLYMPTIGNRMDHVMKTLTTIATIFIPLTFVAGVYGMSFKSMPELEWEHDYFVILGVMFFTGSGHVHLYAETEMVLNILEICFF